MSWTVSLVLVMVSASLGSEMIMSYTGSLFLVRQGCPRYPAYFTRYDANEAAQQLLTMYIIHKMCVKLKVNSILIIQ